MSGFWGNFGPFAVLAEPSSRRLGRKHGRLRVGNDLVPIDGGGKMQRRGPRGQDVSPEKIETFLVTLGMTCNVAMSARKAGFSQSWAYRLRKRDAGFRAGWADAVREGYAKLELVLLERVMKGTRRVVIGRDGSTRIIREYSTALAIALLKRHAEAAAQASYEHDPDDMREVRDRILEKLERLRAQDEALRDETSTSSVSPQDERVQVKGIDRVRLIVWGLGREKDLRSPCLSRRGERG